MAKSGMLSLESLPLHHAGNLPRALIFPVNWLKIHTLSQKRVCNPFSFTHFQNKGLKTLSFHTLSKKGWGCPSFMPDKSPDWSLGEIL